MKRIISFFYGEARANIHSKIQFSPRVLVVELVFLIGLATSFFSGLVGIAGGIMAGPALLYLLPALGGTALDMKAVAGLTMTQGLFASLSGAFRHGKAGFSNARLVSWIAPGMVAFMALGAVLSKYLSERLLLAIFAFLALAASASMLAPAKEAEAGAREVIFIRWKALLLGSAIGFLGGLVGQGGSFILIPAMIYILGIPIRAALGSNLAIVSLAALAGFLGKLVSGQVALVPALALVAGCLPGAQLGAYLSTRTSPLIIKRLLAGIIGLAAARIWMQVLG